MIHFENLTKIKIEISDLNKIADYLTTKDIELLMVDKEYMKKLNLKSRGKDETTDVLSFPLEDIEFAPLGSIVINLEEAMENSKKLKHSLEEEVALLFIHALLHLLGYDHEKDNGEMRKREKEIIEKFSLPKSLIVRNE